MMELLNSIWNLVPVTLAQSLMYALVALGAVSYTHLTLPTNREV